MAFKPMLYILNSKQRVIGVASNNSPDALPYFEDNLIESIETGVVTYEFAVPAKHKDSKNLVASNHVIVRDLDGNFLLFTIREVSEAHEDGKLIKRVFCENTAVGEMLGQVIKPQKIASATLANALKTIFLDVAEWSVLEIPYTMAKDVEIKEHMNLLEVLKYLTELYEMEMFFTVELASVHIKKKVVRFTKKRGKDTNVRFEYGLNLTGVTRKEDSTGVITALYGLGKGEGNEALSLKNYKHEDDGNFYHLAMTDFIGSKEALTRWGRNGQHVYGIYKSDTADTVEQLYKETLAELKRRVNPVLTYESSVVTLERITGYSGQAVRVGDRVLVIDKTFNPVIVLAARVIELQRSFTNPTEDAVKLGEYRPLQPSFSKLLKKVQDATNQAVKYPDLPKIQQDFTDEVIKPIITVVDEMEEEVEETVQAVVNIKASVEGMQADYSEIKEVIQDVKIYKQDTPPTGVPVNTLWIDTSKKPNFQYRWDGTSWVALAPATAEDIGAIGNDFFNEKMEAIDADTAKINAAIKATDGKVATMQTDIASKVDATWVNGQLVSKANVGASYTKAESDNALNGKVSTTTYTTDKNGIINRLDSAETRVTQTENSVKLAATKDELTQASDGLTTKINKVSSDLTVQAGLISSKVSSDTYTTDKAANETRFKSAESRLTQTEADVKLKINATDVYKKTEVDNKVNAKVDTTVYNNKIAAIEATNTSITQKVEEVNSTVKGLSSGGRQLLFNANFAKYKTQALPWDTALNGNIVPDGYWSNGYNAGTTSPTVGYHAHLNITKFGYPVVEFIDKNTQFGFGHRWLGMSNTILLDSPFVKALEVGKEFTISMEVMADTVGMKMNVGFHHFITGNTTQGFHGYQWDLAPAVKANVWEKKSYTFKIDDKWDLTKALSFYLYGYFSTVEGTMWVRNIILEEGNVPSTAQPAPEEVDAQINSKVNSEEYNAKVAEIKVTTDGITQSVSDVNKTVTAQGTRLSTAESNITQANTQIGLKVNSTDVYKKAEVDGKVNAKVDATTYNNKMAELKITTDAITQSVESVKNTASNTGNNILMNSGWYEDTKYWGMDAGVTRDASLVFEGYPIVKIIQSGLTTNSWRGVGHQYMPMTVGKTLTLSIWVYAPDPTSLDAGASCEVRSYDKTKTRIMNQTFAVDMKPTKANTWERKTRTFDLTDKAIQYVDFKAWVTKNGTIYVSKPQLEFGDVVTPWSPNTLDGFATMYENKVASIDTSITGITQRVTNTESSTTSLGSRMTTAEGKITTQAGQISSKVESTTYNTDMNGLKGRVDKAETWINQTTTDITFLAKKNEVGSLLNQSPDGFKILGKYLDISGLVTFSTFDAATQSKINAIDTKAGDGVTKANAAQTAANNAQSTANTANSNATNAKSKTDAWTINSTQINGASIATGTVTANQLNVNNIFANSAVVSAISTYKINADNINAGTIKGIKYESINATNPKIKLVLEGNTVKSYGAADATTKVQNYSEVKEGQVTVFEVAENGSPFGDKQSVIQPARMNVTQGSRSGALYPTELAFWVPNMTGKINYDISPKNNTGYALRLEALGGVHIKSTDNNQSALSFETTGAIYFDGYGNIKGDEYGSVGSTWSVKDGGGRIKLLIPVGKGGGGATELRSHGSGTDFLYNEYRFMSFWGDSVNRVIRFGDGGQLKWQANQGRFEFRNFGDTGWSDAAAGTFTSASSFKWKTDIKNYEGNATDIIANSNIMTYKMKPSENTETNELPDISTLPTHIGLIAEYAPKEVQSGDGAGVDLYSMISVAWKSIQELKTEINEIKAENALLKAQLVGTNN
ncbi:phage tail spike protein [Bacillus nitratireducens]|uniref:phage tail spike protein n=1 Tax=Bacillus nitratireducens TaxID=2026193 RepID=UPI0011AB06FB|nr:phage tail spike protein [Bacillus nitratireducens]